MDHNQIQKQLFLFGDQTFVLQPHLKNLLERTTHSSALDSFLLKAHDKICYETTKLPGRTGDNIEAEINTLEGLLGWEQDNGGNTRRCIALEMALACLLQLASFMLAQDVDELWAAKAANQARSTGGLAAAAVGCSRTIADLQKLGSEAVGIAFRTGALTDEVSLSDATSFDLREQSWATAVIGPGAADTVRSYCEQQESDCTKLLPFITAFAPRGVTVSGTPTSLAHMRSSPAFKNFELKELPLYGLYHDPHLFSGRAVQSLLADVTPESAAKKCTAPVIFGSGEELQGNFGSLIAAAVMRILREPLRWVKLVDALKDWCQGTTADAVNADVATSGLLINAFGSKAGSLIMKQTDVECSLVEHPCQ